MSGRTDAELVAAVVAGHTDSFALLAERYQDGMYRFALGMVGDSDAAADLVQDALIKSFTHLRSCAEPARFRAWIFRILRNRALDHLKNLRQRTVRIDDAGPLESADDATAELDHATTQALVYRALAQLPAAQREAFLMKHVDDLSYEEMAERTGASVSALKMRVMRAREVLAELLREQI